MPLQKCFPPLPDDYFEKPSPGSTVEPPKRTRKRTRKTSEDLRAEADRLLSLSHAVHKLEVARSQVEVAQECVAKLQQERPLDAGEVLALGEAGEELDAVCGELADTVQRAHKRIVAKARAETRDNAARLVEAAFSLPPLNLY